MMIEVLPIKIHMQTIQICIDVKIGFEDSYVLMACEDIFAYIITDFEMLECEMASA